METTIRKDLIEFYVNGSRVEAPAGWKMIRFLRDELKLTSVKNGCSEGACGTCTVLVDGKPTKACILTTDRAAGKQIITCEGLTPREREVYAYAFTACGAVQCGFCTPGMVMSVKGLLDQNVEPTYEQVREAVRNNICRCTGYKKIIEAALLAARIFREQQPVPENTLKGLLGDSLPRVDAPAKALGEARYCDDLYFDGMLYGVALRSAYPRAKILSIDTGDAEKMEGVVRILTANDIPGKQKIGHLQQDYDVMIPVGGITHFLGDAVALVAAETMEQARSAAAAIRVEYEELPGVFDMMEGLKDEILVHASNGTNVLAHEHLVRGNVEEAIQNSRYVVTNHYSVPPTEHAFLEPECAVAMPEGDGVRIFSGDQGIYQTQKECAAMLGLEREKVRVTSMMVGGGFGGKEDMSVQHHAALLAYLTKKPVKVTFTRAESILIHPKRHAMEMDFTTACDENGYLTAMKAVLVSDTGAYASLGGPVLQRACTHAAGPYNFQNIDIDGKAIYTNNPPAGAFRGFGVTQSNFAMECNLNRLAEMVGITPFEIRYRNAIRPGQVLPNGQIADETTALVETLDEGRPILEKNPKAGIACAMKNSGVGVGIPDTGRCRIEILDGKVHLHSAAACIGQGMGTVQVQMVIETLRIPPEMVVYHEPDTALSPDAGVTTASRQTLFTGEATKRAAALVKEAAEKAGGIDKLEGQSFLGEYTGITDKIGSDKPNPVSHIAYGYATHVVELDEEGRISKVTAVHDVGRTVNPVAVEGQIDGGVVMSLGYALTEDFPQSNGKPLAKFGTLGLWKANQIPEIKSVPIGKASSEGLAYGAKGVGEIAAIPTAAAVQNAYYNRDGIFRTKLPLEQTPYTKKKKPS